MRLRLIFEPHTARTIRSVASRSLPPADRLPSARSSLRVIFERGHITAEIARWVRGPRRFSRIIVECRGRRRLRQGSAPQFQPQVRAPDRARCRSSVDGAGAHAARVGPRSRSQRAGGGYTYLAIVPEAQPIATPPNTSSNGSRASGLRMETIAKRTHQASPNPRLYIQ